MNFHGLNVRCPNRMICVSWWHYCGSWAFGRITGVTLGLYLPQSLVHDKVKLLPCDHETHNHGIRSLKPQDTYTNLSQLTLFLSRVSVIEMNKPHYHISIPLVSSVGGSLEALPSSYYHCRTQNRGRERSRPSVTASSPTQTLHDSRG